MKAHNPNETATKGVFTRVLLQVKRKVAQLFEPEEVEVNFVHEGGRIKYTYKKVSGKAA